MDTKIPTIKEIAKRLNVSVSTVSRALHDHPSIGLRTKMQVKALAKELNYEPNQAAISFKQGRTSTIGVITPRLSEEFFASAISGIEEIAGQHKYNVLIGQSFDEKDRERRIIETMRNSRVDGLIISVAKTTDTFEHLVSIPVPVVFFDCLPDLPDLNSVSCNLSNGTVDAVTFLAARGHRRIALLNGPSQLQACIQRKSFYLDGLKKNKLKTDASLIVETDLSKTRLLAAMDDLLALRQRPTAIIAFNDYVALSAMQYARSKKIRVNKDIAFVSFAHLPLCDYMDNPPLASVEQFPYEQGYRAADMLLTILNGRGDKPRVASQIVLQSELIPWKEA